MKHIRTMLILAAGAIPAAATANYVGTLKAPQSIFSPAGIYARTVATPALASALDPGYRLKLGYKYSRYLAVEGEYVDFRGTPGLFAPATLAAGERGTGFGIDTIATLPAWGFSFYGKLGAYRGDARGGFGAYSTSLLPDHYSRGGRWRYGLGLRYDFTRSLGVRAELERHSPLGSSLLTEVDAGDQVSVGLSWRF